MSDRVSVPDGLVIGRLIKAIHAAGGDIVAAEFYAEGQREAWRYTPEVFRIIRTAVVGMTTVNSSPMAYTQGIYDAYLPLLRARTLLDRIAGWRRVPANSSVLRYTSDLSSGGLVAEGVAVPVSKFALERVVLPVKKIGALTVTAKEVLENSSPAAEASLAQELAKALGAATDRAMFNIDNTGSIANTGTIITSAGSSLANVDADLKLMFANFASADAALDNCVFVTSPSTAAYLASLRGTGGVNAFPQISVKGGNLYGVPVFISAALQGVGSPGNSQLTLFNPAEVLVAADDAVEISTSENASLEMSDSPTEEVSTPTASTSVSMFQSNTAALLGLRWASWLLSRTTGCITLKNVSY